MFCFLRQGTVLVGFWVAPVTVFYIFLSTYPDGGFSRDNGAVLYGGGHRGWYFKIYFKFILSHIHLNKNFSQQ
jgi:hypothetical protein